MKQEQLAKRAREVFRYSEGELFWKVVPKYHPKKKNGLAGSLNKKGYWKIQLDGKKYQRAHLVYLIHHNKLPSPMCDHINRSRQDDRIENLREASAELNARNHSRFNITKRNNGFQARLGQYNIGLFKTEEEARLAYNKRRKEIYGV